MTESPCTGGFLDGRPTASAPACLDDEGGRDSAIYAEAMTEPPGPHDPEGVVVKALLAACPSFADRWTEHLASSDGGIGPYIDAGAFANHLVDLLDWDETTEFPAVFDAVERLLTEGDDGVRYLVTWGLIESLQNVASNRSEWAFAGRFRQWLGPATLSAWDEVHVLWGTSDTGAG
jgi:hypothetical protein